MSDPSPPTHLVGVKPRLGSNLRLIDHVCSLTPNTPGWGQVWGGGVGVPCYTTGACIFKVGAMEIFCPGKLLCKFHKLWELSAFGSLIVYSHN